MESFEAEFSVASKAMGRPAFPLIVLFSFRIQNYCEVVLHLTFRFPRCEYSQPNRKRRWLIDRFTLWHETHVFHYVCFPKTIECDVLALYPQKEQQWECSPVSQLKDIPKAENTVKQRPALWHQTLHRLRSHSRPFPTLNMEWDSKGDMSEYWGLRTQYSVICPSAIPLHVQQPVKLLKRFQAGSNYLSKKNSYESPTRHIAWISYLRRSFWSLTRPSTLEGL